MLPYFQLFGSLMLSITAGFFCLFVCFCFVLFCFVLFCFFHRVEMKLILNNGEVLPNIDVLLSFET